MTVEWTVVRSSLQPGCNTGASVLASMKDVARSPAISLGCHSYHDGASLRGCDSFLPPTPNSQPLLSRVGERTASSCSCGRCLPAAELWPLWDKW